MSYPEIPQRADYILVGGGLQNSLIALALLEAQPDASIVVVERGATLGGNHTWCFHARDIAPGAKRFVDPLVRHRWAGYSVSFPNHQRCIDAPYAAATSDQLHATVCERFAGAERAHLLLNTAATRVAGDHVVIEGGARIDAGVVIDARGPVEWIPDAGYQKFFGIEVELEHEHGIERPVLMDATVPQEDGFRFFYLLPFSPTSLLIEDTYFSDNAILDHAGIEKRVVEYAGSRGFRIAKVLRREHGVLPLPWQGDVTAPKASPMLAGYRGGWFHPATGYSFPVAARLASAVASKTPAQLFGADLTDLFEEQRRQVRYCQKLNRMLFAWFKPEDRWNVFERFYRLPEDLIHRFYSLELSAMDRARILIGRPPRGLSIKTAIARRSLQS